MKYYIWDLSWLTNNTNLIWLWITKYKKFTRFARYILTSHIRRIIALFFSLIPHKSRSTTKFIVNSTNTFAKTRFAFSLRVKTIAVIASYGVAFSWWTGGWWRRWFVAVSAIAVANWTRTTIYSFFVIALVIWLSKHQLKWTKLVRLGQNWSKMVHSKPLGAPKISERRSF